MNLSEEAIKFTIFLIDADRLFDVALGMYDFNLVIMVAQHSQRVILIHLLQSISFCFDPFYSLLIIKLRFLFIGSEGIFNFFSRIGKVPKILPKIQN